MKYRQKPVVSPMDISLSGVKSFYRGDEFLILIVTGATIVSRVVTATGSADYLHLHSSRTQDFPCTVGLPLDFERANHPKHALFTFLVLYH